MSSERSFPTFVDVNSSHMTAASGDQPMSITVFVDQSPSGISNDSQSSEHLQKELVKNLRSPDDQEVEIYEGDPSNVEDTTHVWVKEEVRVTSSFSFDSQFSPVHCCCCLKNGQLLQFRPITNLANHHYVTEDSAN